MIVDTHTHIGRVRDRDFTTEALLDRMDDAGVDHAIAYSFAENIDNARIAEAARRHADRILPVAVVNPWHDDAEAELRRRLDDGFVGLHLHPVRHGYPLDREWLVDPVIRIAAEYRVPVIAFGGHDYFSTPDRFDVIAQRHPDATFVMSHMGYSTERDGAKRVLESRPNVYVETSGVQVPRYVQTALAVDPGRVLFGSNAPHEDIPEALRLIDAATPDPAVRRLTLHENAGRLFGLTSEDAA